jgi:regulator of CtrA degradation
MRFRKDVVSTMASRIQSSGNTANVVFMPRVFNETMQLLGEAHEYFHLFGEDDQSRIESNLKPLYSCEMSRITLRLSSIMAWIMVQRAVFSGKINPDEAAERYGLDFQEICSVDNRMLHGVLPSYVCLLLDRSLELYERVRRLDDQIKQQHQIH